MAGFDYTLPHFLTHPAAVRPFVPWRLESLSDIRVSGSALDAGPPYRCCML